MEDVVIAPASEFQEKYLQSDAQIILVGGAAGSSKSYVGLMRHLRWAEDPNYRSYCIRKNSSAIMASGGLFWEAVALYRHYDPDIQVKLKDQKIVFSSGAEISFSHYENDAAAKKYQGIQISNIFYDEVTHADNEEQIWWLWSRLRSNSKNIHSIWMSCNPDNASWVLKYAEWYLYPEGHEHAGRPDPEKNGKIRYLLRIGGELFWSESAEYLIKTYGNPDLPDDHEDQVKPISFMGLFGTIYDNPPLMKSNPTYKSNLEALPRVERERLLLGNWFARPTGSTYFERDWCEEVDYVDEKEVLYTVRTFDFAGTLKSDVNPNPDYTASVRMRKMKDGMYVIDDIRRHRIRHGDWFEWVMDCAAKDPRGTTYYIPEDPNPAAKRASVLFARELSEAGLAVKRLRTNRSKLDRFRPFSSMAQNEGVHFLSNCATCEDSEIYNDNTFAYLELETFTGVRNRGAHGHDDVVDAISDAFSVLASKTTSLSGISRGLNTMSKGLVDGNMFNTF